MKSGTRDEAEGKWHQVKGKVKEIAGKVSMNPDLEAEGKAESQSLIGRDAPAVEAAIAPAGVPCAREATMEAAVEAAFRLASPGDAVLLSTACASFDMFANYRQRGEVFAAAARALARRVEG